jgi:L-seryl-tRNA(Ser) seleniumtransferase
MSNQYRVIPSVDRVLAHPVLEELLQQYDRDIVVDAVRVQIDAVRSAVAGGADALTLDQVAETVAAKSARRWRQWPVPVINATGVILHTNLGRAPLSQESIEAIVNGAFGYSSLEFDLDAGQRGTRHHAVAGLIRQLTGAEDALVVNNNASAMFLGLSAIASGREVIVSRGEAVEIGGGFRIPDVLRQSGAHLVEVGATNRTYPRDYAEAITPETGALLAVHRSNFQVVGFTNNPSLSDLVNLAHERGLPLLHDLGSGALLDTATFGLTHEPMPQESMVAGVDLVFFSGDKLLGGPQAGIIAGKREMVAQLARHPLARAVRIDKLSLAALHATLLHYLKGEAVQRIPIWQMISAPKEQMEVKAREWAGTLGPEAEVTQGQSTIGGGSLPGEEFDTWLVSISTVGKTGGAGALAATLRQQATPVIVRIEEEHVLVDPRTVLQQQQSALLASLKEVTEG